jgi:hypothetical protein
MSNVIRFLESMGRQPMPQAEYAGHVAALGVDEMQRVALLNRDQLALNIALQGRGNVFFGVFAAEEEEEQVQELAA